jgi:hypothetical protein
MRRIESRVCLALKIDRDPVCMRMNWIRTRPGKMYHYADPAFDNGSDPYPTKI